MILLGVFAALALILSSVGYLRRDLVFVGQRTQEIGIRVALGARRWDVLQLHPAPGVKRRSLAGHRNRRSLASTLLMERCSMGLAQRPHHIVAVAAVLLSVCACRQLHSRAPRHAVDPIVALRYE